MPQFALAGVGEPIRRQFADGVDLDAGEAEPAGLREPAAESAGRAIRA